MTQHKFSDETVTIIVLGQVVKDMRHLLDWLAIGLGCMAIINLIHATDDAVKHEWISLGFDLLFTAAFMAWSWGTAKRAKRYASKGGK